MTTTLRLLAAAIALSSLAGCFHHHRHHRLSAQTDVPAPAEVRR